MAEPGRVTGFHERDDARAAAAVPPFSANPGFSYTFKNFFHPFVGEMIERLNSASLAGLLDPDFQQGLAQPFFDKHYRAANSPLVQVKSFPKEIDVSVGGPYANYNWELLFHIPVAIAVHLSNNQRFAEAQRWMHYVFDPTSTDTSTPAPKRYWRFLRFRQGDGLQDLEQLLVLLSQGGTQDAVLELLNGYDAIVEHPFAPHRVAATRPLAYQYYVVMKYLDNLIAWGDSLFREDSIESITEATQRYVLASNILGPRPQQLPQRGTVAPKSYAQLKEHLDKLGNELVDLESRFPFNLAHASSRFASDNAHTAATASIGQTLYFCVPRNQKLLSYWDTVADRLFKIRNCMNLEGLTRQLALFEPRIDPGLLVKAAAAGIDVGAMAGGQLQPVGGLRTPFLLGQAREVCSDVRALAQGLLGAIEKADAEDVAQLRQAHETAMQSLAQDVRFLQWRQAQASTEVLLRAREMAIERHRYYRRLLGAKDGADQGHLVIQRPAAGEGPLLNEGNFDTAFAAMVSAYDLSASIDAYPDLRLVGDSSPSSQSGASGSGRLNLSSTEDKELNELLPTARDLHAASSVLDTVASVLTLIPNLSVDLHFWGLGLHAEVFGGDKIADVSRIAAGIVRTIAGWEQDQAGMAALKASYERRGDEWVLQSNLAARELMQIGKQLLVSVITEQAAHREYLNAGVQAQQGAEISKRLQDKFSNKELYVWMQGEITRLYYEYYRFAVDVARKAEQTMKRELMRPEVDATQYIKTDYLNLSSGRQGLLAGEALALDIKRMEMAYYENRRREYELTRHVSLAQLDPMALLQLRATGACDISIPEAFFDLGCPGHYMRRIKQVKLSIPAVAGPYTSVACTLSLLRSSLRTTATGATGESYARKGDDARFVDYAGVIQAVVTSDGREDSGVFDSSARDERFLPFEGAGAISAWRLELPRDFRQFDYDTISDVILHLHYTAREGGGALRQGAAENLTKLVAQAQASGSARLISVRQEFPNDWAAMKGVDLQASGGTAPLRVTLGEQHYPYWSTGMDRKLRQVALVAKAAPDTAQIQVSAVPSPTAQQQDTLSKDDGLSGLLHGTLDKATPQAATGEVKLFLSDNRIADLWLLVTWSGSRATA